jgi:hypothetical protein
VLTLYHCLLYLYPAAYRQEFGEEMTSVFSEAWQSMASNLAARFQFCTREVQGLIFSAAREHLHVFMGSGNSFRRFKMRPEFHFPRSTVVLMLVIFAGVVLTIVKATSVELAYGVTLGTVWPSLISILLCMIVTMFAVAAIGWGILHALGRTGAHRMANIEIWPKAK